MKHKPLREQVIVITGASSGIGLATARMAAERGAAKNTLLAYRRDLAHDENARSASIQIRSGFCGMDGPDPQRSLDRRQDKTRRYHSRW